MTSGETDGETSHIASQLKERAQKLNMAIPRLQETLQAKLHSYQLFGSHQYDPDMLMESYIDEHLLSKKGQQPFTWSSSARIEAVMEKHRGTRVKRFKDSKEVIEKKRAKRIKDRIAAKNAKAAMSLKFKIPTAVPKDKSYYNNYPIKKNEILVSKVKSSPLTTDISNSAFKLPGIVKMSYNFEDSKGLNMMQWAALRKFSDITNIMPEFTFTSIQKKYCQKRDALLMKLELIPRGSTKYGAMAESIIQDCRDYLLSGQTNKKNCMFDPVIKKEYIEVSKELVKHSDLLDKVFPGHTKENDQKYVTLRDVKSELEGSLLKNVSINKSYVQVVREYNRDECLDIKDKLKAIMYPNGAPMKVDRKGTHKLMKEYSSKIEVLSVRMAVPGMGRKKEAKKELKKLLSNRPVAKTSIIDENRYDMLSELYDAELVKNCWYMVRSGVIKPRNKEINAIKKLRKYEDKERKRLKEVNDELNTMLDENRLTTFSECVAPTLEPQKVFSRITPFRYTVPPPTYTEVFKPKYVKNKEMDEHYKEHTTKFFDPDFCQPIYYRGSISVRPHYNFRFDMKMSNVSYSDEEMSKYIVLSVAPPRKEGRKMEYYEHKFEEHKATKLMEFEFSKTMAAQKKKGITKEAAMAKRARGIDKDKAELIEEWKDKDKKKGIVRGIVEVDDEDDEDIELTHPAYAEASNIQRYLAAKRAKMAEQVTKEVRAAEVKKASDKLKFIGKVVEYAGKVREEERVRSKLWKAKVKRLFDSAKEVYDVPSLIPKHLTLKPWGLEYEETVDYFPALAHNWEPLVEYLKYNETSYPHVLLMIMINDSKNFKDYAFSMDDLLAHADDCAYYLEHYTGYRLPYTPEDPFKSQATLTLMTY